MLTANIFQRVFRIQHNGKTASAYTIEKGENQYLVSASHVFEGTVEIPHVTIYHNKKWINIEVQTVFNSLDVGDTIIFKLSCDISPRHEVTLGPDKILLGSWAYFLGFPFGMSTPSGVLNNHYPVPFVKAALISSINAESEGLTTVYLDGHNNKGFSGGPAVWVDPSIDPWGDPPGILEMKIIGTVSNYLTESPIHTLTLDDIKDHGTNAGIVEVFWIRNILDLI